MKNSNLDYLKGSTGFLLFVSIVLYVFTLAYPIFITGKPDEVFMPWLEFSPNAININSVWDKILLFFSTLNYTILLYALYQFRALLILFQNNIIFEKKTQKQLKFIGKLIIISSSIFFFIDILLSLIHWKLHVKMNNIYFALLSVGYFFNVLAEVFKRGTELKEENELTI